LFSSGARAMAETIQFRCSCGKVLSADAILAGRKAKCGGCGSVVQIPVPQPAATARSRTQGETTPRSTPAPKPAASKSRKTAAQVTAPSSKSNWNDEQDYELDRLDLSQPPQSPKATPGAKPPTEPAKKQSSNRLLLIYTGAFAVYCLVVLLVSLASPILSMVLVMPLVLVAVLAVALGSLWYFLVLLRDNPDEAGVIFFGILLAFVGLRASTSGYISGRMRRGRAANPSHAAPLKILRFGFTCIAFGAGAALIVGILFGRWKPDVLNRERFAMPAAGVEHRPIPPVGPKRPAIDRLFDK
jgi:hypothetical protein